MFLTSLTIARPARTIASLTTIALSAFTIAVLLLPGIANAQYTFTNIADTITTTPPENGKYIGFGVPSISGSNVAFYAASTGGDTGTRGIFRSNGTTTVVVARNALGAPAETPYGGTFSAFGSTPSISGINVAFNGTYNNGAGYSGIFLNNGTTTTGIARNGTGAGAATPNGGTFSPFDSNPSISGSNVAFYGGYLGGTGNQGIFLSDGTTLTSMAHNGGGAGAATPYGGVFTNIDPNPSISGINVAFMAAYTGGSEGNRGIFRSNGITTTGIARSGTDAGAETPYGGRFSAFGSNPSISGNNVAFTANYSGGLGTRGLFLSDGTTLTAIARNGEDAGAATPIGGRFDTFNTFAISGSNVAFTANYTGQAIGLFAFSSTTNSLTSIIKKGDSLFGSTLSSVTIQSGGMDGNNIAFYYALASGRNGIAVASLAPAVVPEASTLALALPALGMIGAVVIKRRKSA